MGTRRRRSRQRVVCLLCLLAFNGSTALADTQSTLIHGSLDVIDTATAQAPSTSAAFDQNESNLRYEEAEQQYKYALDLLETLRARSVPIVAPPPPTSLFSSASYTPFLNLIERANRGPISPLIRIARRFFASKQPQDTATEGYSGWSLHRWLRRLKGNDGLLGRPSTEAKIPPGNGPLSPKQVNRGAGEVIKALSRAAELGKTEAHSTLGDLFLWGRHSLQRNTSRAFEHYKQLADLTGDVNAQYILGFLHSSAFDGVLGQAGHPQGEGDQGLALLYYTFAALGQSPEAEMAAGYRHWVGIGTRQSCGDALPFYKKAADKGELSPHRAS